MSDDETNNNKIGEDENKLPNNDSGAHASSSPQQEETNEHMKNHHQRQAGTFEDAAASLEQSRGGLSHHLQHPPQQEVVEQANSQQFASTNSWNTPQIPADCNAETALPPEVAGESHDVTASSIQTQYHPSPMMMLPPESLLPESGGGNVLVAMPPSSSQQQQSPMLFAPAHYLRLPAAAGYIAGNNPLAGTVGYAGGMVPMTTALSGAQPHLPNTGEGGAVFSAPQLLGVAAAAAGSFPQSLLLSQQLYQHQMFLHYQQQQQVAMSSAMLQQPTPFTVASVGEALMMPQEESMVGNQPSSNTTNDPPASPFSVSRKRSHSASSRRGSTTRNNKSNNNKPEGFGALAERVNDKLAERKPKRPLSAYNIFFKDERARLLQNRGDDTMTGGEGSVNEDVKPAAEDDNNASVRTTDTPHGTETAATATSESTSEATKRNQRGKPPHKKIGFEAMAKTISKRWKEISPEQLADCQRRAEADKKRYQAEMSLYKEKRRNALEATRETLEASVPESVRNDYLSRS